MNINLKRQWLLVPILASVVGLLVVIVAGQFFPRLTPYALLLLLIPVGVSFLWAFVKQSVWWAVAPGVEVLAAALAVLVNLFLPNNNGWIAVLILGAGAFVIAAIPNRRAEINVAHFLGIIVVVIGFLISPLRIMWKIVFIVASVLLAAYFAWLDREDMRRLFTS
jgi:hypothetical protein